MKKTGSSDDPGRERRFDQQTSLTKNTMNYQFGISSLFGRICERGVVIEADNDDWEAITVSLLLKISCFVTFLAPKATRIE